MSELSTTPPAAPEPSLPVEKTPAPQGYVRFTLSQRIEHITLLTSFTLLGLTGIPQKYADSPLSQAIIAAFGGIEGIRLVHHVAAFVLLVLSIYHIIAVLYKVIVQRTSLDMLPVIEDFTHLFQDIQYYLGLRKHRAYFGRYSYGEKLEYLAVVWGTIIMAITGFMMWNPIATTRLMPGAAIPAAKAAHGGEALLAVLSIILWHMYNVHVRHFNKSMFTGKLTEEEMRHEHPAELAQVKNREALPVVAPEILRRRRQVFYPLAVGLTVFSFAGLWFFLRYEQTAITTIPRGENVQVFVQVTATPRPAPTITPTVNPNAPVNPNTWEGTYQELFRNRCGTCHVVTNVGGLNLGDYQSALKGGQSGPGIVPANPDGSMMVKIQQAGSHPGQLTADEIARLIDWINAGAPEK
jgi:cytochrome b subunit of formate dehydrogenase